MKKPITEYVNGGSGFRESIDKYVINITEPLRYEVFPHNELTMKTEFPSRMGF